MKQLLIALVLSLALGACATPPEPQIVYVEVTATPAPTPEAPTDLAQADDIFEPLGFERASYDTEGENDCTKDYCVYYTYPDADMLAALFVTNGNFMGITVAFGYEDADIASAMFFAVRGLQAAGIPEDDLECAIDTDGEGGKECGQLFVNVVYGDGRLYYVYVPMGSHGPRLWEG